MYHVMQHQAGGEIVHVGSAHTPAEAIAICNRVEEEWAGDLYGAAFISQEGIIVGDRGGIDETPERCEILGYSHACGYHD